MCLFCRHRNWTAVARFTQNKKKYGRVAMQQVRKIRRDAYVFNATVATRICFVSRCMTN